MTLNNSFAFQLDAVGIPYEREYKAIPGRRFRFDFKVENILIDLQGGIYQYYPSHTSAKHIIRDCEKLNLAVVNGYKVLHFTTGMVKSGEALNIVEKILGSK